MNAVDVVNLALGMMGDDQITSIVPPDDSDRARLAASLYEPLLKKVMGACPWNFAMTRVVLSPDVATPAWGYSYAFTLPTDCLRVHRMEDKSIEFRVEKGKIVCDEATVNIRYIAYVKDPNKWDAGFTDAFALKLASRMSTLMGDKSKGENFEKLYEIEIRDAILDNTKEGWPESWSSNALTDVRKE